MTTSRAIFAAAAVLAAATVVIAQQQPPQPPKPQTAKPAPRQPPQAPARDLSPAGSSAAQVNGTWVKSAAQAFTAGGSRYTGGKWIDITYGRPLLRGRDVFGSGETYGKDLLVGAPIWRAGANVTTQLTSEVPIIIGDKKLQAGKAYDVFIDVKEHDWTLVLSTIPAQKKYDPNDKVNVYGAYNYTPDSDVLRTKMKLETLPHSFDELSWQFLDMTTSAGTLGLIWGTTLATVQFTAG